MSGDIHYTMQSYFIQQTDWLMVHCADGLVFLVVAIQFVDHIINFRELDKAKKITPEVYTLLFVAHAYH